VKAKTCTIVLRGGAEQFIEETERSLHDAIMIVRRTIKNDAIVAGVALPEVVDLVWHFCECSVIGAEVVNSVGRVELDSDF